MPGVTVEQLNFKLIVDDAEFNAKVKDTQKAAEELNANLSQILDIKNKISSVSSADVANQRNANKILADNAKTQEKIATDAERAAQARRKVIETTTSQITRENAINREKEAQAALKTQMAQERLNQLQERGRRTLQASSRLWQQMAAMAATYFSVAGATRLVRTLVDVSAEFENQKVTLGAILKDTEKANELYEQIKDLAVQSPFAFKELVTYAKQLSAFSVPAKELFETTKMLADVSAGLGVGMDRLVLAYGQIRSASFLRGQEVRQLTEAGIPILEELRKQFVALGEEGITVGDVFDKISKRLVPFSMVEKVFIDMTSEGGKFYKMQEVQAETLKGKISNLTDAYQIMFSEIGEKNEGLLKGSVDILRGIAENYQKIGNVLVGLIGAYGAYRVAVLGATIAEKAELIAKGNMIKSGQALVKTLKLLITETKTYAAVQKALSKVNWVGVAVAAVAGLGIALLNAANQAKKFREELDKIAADHMNDAEKMVKDYQNLVRGLEGVTQGSQKYRDAIAELNRKYGEYLPNLLTEKTTLAELKGLEVELTNSIRTRMRAYAEAEGFQKIQDRFGKRADEAVGGLLTNLKAQGFTDEEADDIVAKFNSALEKSSGSVKSVFDTIMSEYLQSEDFLGKVQNPVLWKDAADAAAVYGRAVRKVNDEQDKFLRQLNARAGFSGYGSREERQIAEQIDEEFRLGAKAAKEAASSTEEYEKALKDLQKVRLDKLIAAFSEAEGKNKGAWTKRIQDLKNELDSLNGNELTTFQSLISPLLSGEGVQDLLPQTGEDVNEYLSKLRKDYKDLSERVKDADAMYKKLISDKEKGLDVDEKAITMQKESLDQLEKRKKTIEDIGDKLGVSVDDKIKRETRSSGKSQAQEELEEEIATLKDLYSWYKRFQELGVDDSRAGAILSRFFPEQSELINGKRLEEQLLADADAMEKYGTAGQKAAASIRDFLGVKSVSGTFDTFKNQLAAFDKYRKQVQDWIDKDYGLEGTDISFKASQILTRLATQNAQTLTDAGELKKLYAEATKDEEVLKLIRELYGEEVWNKYLKEGEKVIDELVEEETSANRKIAQEKINALAEGYVKQKLFEKDLDMTDWGDKSYKQVKAITEQLKEMYVAPIEMSDEMRAKAKELGIDLDQLAENIKKIIDNKWRNTTVEEMKKLADVAKRVSSAVSSFGDIFSDLGESVDSDVLSNFGDLLDMASRTADAVLECTSLMEAMGEVESTDFLKDVVNSADIFTMILKIALIGVEKVVDAVKEHYRMQIAINEAAIAYRDTLHQIALSDAETIFGTDSMRKAAEGFRNLTRAANDFKKAQDDMVLGRTNTMTLFNAIADMRGFSTAQGGWSAARDEWNRMMGQSYEDSRDYYEWLIANQDVIMQNMTKNQKKAFQNLLSNLESYKNAMDEVDDLMGSIFGGISESIADSLINAFVETGDAATDLADNMRDTFSDLGLDIAKSLIQSFVISNILNKYRDTVESLFTYMSDSAANPDVIAQKFGELADNITQDADAAAQFTNALLTAMQNNGIDINSQGGTKAMTNGIKSITEDTANLLASYINAIRADVSYSRTLLETMLGLLPSAPTLAEYLTQIQANTYNNAVATQAILERLDSAMAAYPAGGRAFNVNVS